VIAWLLHLVLCTFDLGHCTRLAWTAGGPRCVEVTLAPRCEQESGWHRVLFVPVCTSHCGKDGPTS
jgi:hypothetical protein